jgi:nitronate monooxygenase
MFGAKPVFASKAFALYFLVLHLQKRAVVAKQMSATTPSSSASSSSSSAIMWKTLFTDTFHCRLPIMGAPMAGAAGGRLAAATTQAGALGFIAAGHLTAHSMKDLQAEIRLYRDLMQQQQQQQQTSSSGGSSTSNEIPLAIGFLGHSVTKDEQAWERYQHILQQEQPTVIQFFAPAITRHPKTGQTNVELAHQILANNNKKVLFLAQVGSVQEGVEAIAAGVDGIIAQGSEAGGHGLRHPHGNPVLALTARLRQLAPAHVPVLAAGGIVDGRSMAAAMVPGLADGVVLGTRLVATPEALGRDAFKQAIVEAKSCDDAIRTTVFDQIQNAYSATPWPIPYDSLGSLKNDFTDTWHDKTDALEQELLQHRQDPSTTSPTTTTTSVLQAFRKATEDGNVRIAPVLAGKGVGEIQSIEPARDVIARIEQDARQMIQNMSQHLLRTTTTALE